MDGRKRTLVAGIHRLKHVKCFIATTLTNDDAARIHAERVLEKEPLCDFTFPFEIGRGEPQVE